MSKQFGLSKEQFGDYANPHTPSRISDAGASIMGQSSVFPPNPPLNPAGASQILEDVGALYPPVKSEVAGNQRNTTMTEGGGQRNYNVDYNTTTRVDQAGHPMSQYPYSNNAEFSTVGSGENRRYTTPQDRETAMKAGFPHLPVANESEELANIRRRRAFKEPLY